MGGIARIDNDRMQFRSIRRAVLHAAHPAAVLRIIVDAGKRRPVDAPVLGTEQPLRRGAGIPDIRFVGMARRQPEGVIDGTSAAAVGDRSKSRRLGGFLPGSPEIRRAEDGRSEMAGLCRREQGSAIARIKQQMIDDVTQKMRPVGSPGLARAIAVIKPRPLARRDHEQGLARTVGFRCRIIDIQCHDSLLINCHSRPAAKHFVTFCFDHVKTGKLHIGVGQCTSTSQPITAKQPPRHA
jgi:hypothetical protein